MELTEWYLLDRNTIESYVGFEQDGCGQRSFSCNFLPGFGACEPDHDDADGR